MDFIIFCPFEDEQDIEEIHKIIQALPKTLPKCRHYPVLPRLTYMEHTPIAEMITESNIVVDNYDRYYANALLYYFCYLMPKEQFETVKKRYNSGELSASKLLKMYQSYLVENGIEIIEGTHEIPSSITTHRYERILKKRDYSNVIVWGAGDYFKEMEHIFKGINICHHIDDGKEERTIGNSTVSPMILANEKEFMPIFICSKRKRDIKMRIINEFPEYIDCIFV